MRFISWFFQFVVFAGFSYVIRKSPLSKLTAKLGENAVIGWIDDEIGKWLGITAPSVGDVLEWLPALILAGAILLLYHLVLNKFQKGPSGASAARYSFKDAGLMHGIYWIADKSSWGRWQKAQHGGRPGESLMFNLASTYLLTAAGNGDLIVRGRIPGTHKYDVIDRHFWLAHFIHYVPDSRTIHRAVVYERPTNTVVATAYDSYLLEQSDLEKLWPVHDLRTDWLTFKIKLRAKVKATARTFRKYPLVAAALLLTAGIVIGVTLKRQHAVAIVPTPNVTQTIPPSSPVNEAATDPSDIPKKISAIDEARRILKSVLENELNDGFKILEEGRSSLSKGDRMPLMTGIPQFYQTWANAWRKIEDLRKANDKFEDINSILDQTYRAGLENGFSSLQGAVGSLGDPPYKMDMHYFFQPHVEDFMSGMAEWGKWLHSTDAALLTLRKKLSK